MPWRPSRLGWRCRAGPPASTAAILHGVRAEPPPSLPEMRGVGAPGRLFGELLDGERKANLHAFGFPVMDQPAAELAADDAAGEQAAEAFALRRPVDDRSAVLLPFDHELILLVGPCDSQATGVRRQGPGLG